MSRPPYSVESLGDHDRLSFACGVEDLDRYLHVQAGQDAKRKVTAPFVMIDADRTIVGYYTLSAYAVRVGELPADLARQLPRYPLLPATLLGRFAVSTVHQGQKLGRLLLMDALFRSWKTTTQVGSIGVVAEAYNDAVRDFYLHYEFIPLLEHPRKLFIAMRTIQKAFS